MNTGLGFADFVMLGLAALLVAAALAWRPWVEPYASALARRTALCMLILAALPVALRLVLLAHHPVPTAGTPEEFSNLLAAGTLRHFRLANPPHALPQFFEPASTDPIGQGLVIALGWAIFGLPWAGVLLSLAAFCPLCYWMLRGWTTPGWALLGGLLAVIEFGPLNLWANSYSSGLAAAAAGCLVFGALPRLRESGSARNAALLGAGLGLHLLVRPHESVFLVAAAALFWAPEVRGGFRVRAVAKPAAAAALAMLPAVLLTFAQNRTAASFFPGAASIGDYLLRLEYRVRFYRFFFLPPLYLAALGFLARLRNWRFAWVAVTLALFALGTNLNPAFEPYYIAGLTCLFVLVAVAGLERLGREPAMLIVLFCCGHFLFWYGMHAADETRASRTARQYESWNGINHQNPSLRIAVARQLAGIPGQLLVFVRQTPQHAVADEWIHNAADMDSARVVWARDLGPVENEKLLRYYPGRVPLLFEPDHRPPRLRAYGEPQ
jgi:hypothetical protein